MPILQQEESVYPETLLEEASPSDDQRWHVVYTRARHEKSLARQLRDNEMNFYLPLVKNEVFTRGRRRCSYLPVFSGYMFYFGNAPGSLSRLAPYCVSGVFEVDDQNQLQSELRQVQALLDSGTPMTVEARLAKGRKVRVKSGALKGLEGTIVKRQKSKRLLVSVHYLQQGVSVEIDDFMLEAL